MIEAPPAIKRQKPKFKPEVEFRVQAEVLLEKSTIVHCRLSGDYEYPAAIRIWPTTFLVQDNGDRKKLLHAYNIAPYPNWKIVNEGHVFTLIFEGLDKNCLLFDLLEDIPEIGGFKFENIKRNDTDVYWVDVD